MSSDGTDSTRQHRLAGACDDCGHPVGGTVAVRADADATVLCEQCADGDQPYGVFVRERFDADDERWYPGEGDAPRMRP